MGNVSSEGPSTVAVRDIQDVTSRLWQGNNWVLRSLHVDALKPHTEKERKTNYNTKEKKRKNNKIQRRKIKRKTEVIRWLGDYHVKDASHILYFTPFNVNAAVQRKKAVSAIDRILHQGALSVFVKYSCNGIMTPEILTKLTIMLREQLVLTTNAVSHNELSDSSNSIFAQMELTDILWFLCF